MQVVLDAMLLIAMAWLIWQIADLRVIITKDKGRVFAAPIRFKDKQFVGKSKPKVINEIEGESNETLQ